MRELYHLACEKIAGFNAKAAELLEEAEADALAYLDFPHGHHRRLRANNVQERVNREVKRRSRVVQVFPSRKSLIRMLGAVLSEKDEDWSTRRRFTATSISEAYEEPERRKPTAKAWSCCTWPISLLNWLLQGFHNFPENKRSGPRR